MKDVNGTRYIVTALSSNLITARKLGANDDKPLLLIPQVIHLTKNDEFPFIMKIPCQVSICDDISESTGTIIGQMQNSS